jgi:hypothetical protein
MYVYGHRLSTTPWPTWYGTVHADELAMFLGQPISSRPYSSAINTNPWLAPRYGYPKNEKLLAQEMMIYLANFIKFNNPNLINATQLLQNKHWPQYNPHSITFRTNDNHFLMFKVNGSRVLKNYEAEKCHFWNSYLPELMAQRGNRNRSSGSSLRLYSQFVCFFAFRLDMPVVHATRVLESSNIQASRATSSVASRAATLLFTLLAFCFV